MKRMIYLYGLAGADQQYRIIRYDHFDMDSVNDIFKEAHIRAAWLRSHDSTIETVYAVPGGHGLKYIFMEAFRTNTVEANVTFKTLLEQRGFIVP